MAAFDGIAGLRDQANPFTRAAPIRTCGHPVHGLKSMVRYGLVKMLRQARQVRQAVKVGKFRSRQAEINASDSVALTMPAEFKLRDLEPHFEPLS
jgi:hypothetical protein